MFKLMSKDLAVLGNMEADVATMRQQATVVLKSLAEVRSPLILVMMMTDTELDPLLRHRAESVLLALWDCLLGAMRAPSGHTPGTSKQVEDLVLSVITAGLDEMDVLPPKCVDKLLGWLLKGGSHPRGAAVAGEALRVSAERIGQPLGQYILAVLAGKQPGIEGTEDMDEEEIKVASQSLDIKDRLTALKVTLLLPPYLPAVLDPIISALAEDIEKTDLAVRVAAVETLGGLFAGPSVSLSSGYSGSGGAGSKKCLGELHASTFLRWLRRFTDTDRTVRALMCRLGSVVVREHPSLAPLVCEKLESRMGESEDLVRHEAVHAACDILVWSLKHAPAPLVKAVAHACKDKNLVVRKEAATGLAQAYGTHMPALWRKSEEWMSANPISGPAHSSAKGKGFKGTGAGEGTGFNPPAVGSVTAYAFTPAEQDSWEKLSVVPSAVLGLYSQPEAQAHQLAVQLLDTIMLPDKIKGEAGAEAEDITEQTRARGLMFLYCSLNGAARRAFSAMQSDRRAVQEAVRQMCALRAALVKLRPATIAPGKAANAANAAAIGELEEKLERVYSLLVRYAGGVAPDVEVKALRKFVAAVGDHKVFRCLEKLMDPSSPLKKLHLDREELTQTLAAATVSISAPAAASKKGKGSEAGLDPQAEAKAIKDIIRQIARKGTLATCTSGMVSPLLLFAREHVATGRLQDAAHTIALCKDLVGTFPAIAVAPAAASPGSKAGTFDHSDDSEGSPVSQAFVSVLSLTTVPLPHAGAVVQSVLDYMAVLGSGAQPGAVAPAFAALPSAVQSDTRSVLLSLSLHATPSLAKRAMAAATAILPTGDGFYRYGAKAEDEGAQTTGASGAVEPMDTFFTSLSAKLRESGTLSSSNPHLPSVLHALGALALRAPRVYEAINAAPAAGKGAGSSPSSVVLTPWLLDHVQSDPEDEPTPVGGEAYALACAAPWDSGLAAARQQDAEDTADQGSEADGEDGAEDDDGNDGFVRRKKGSGAKAGSAAASGAGVKRKAEAAVGAAQGQGASKKGVASRSASSSVPLFKGLRPSYSTLTRCFALRTLGCIARGQGLKSLTLMEVSKVASASPAGGGNSPQLAQLAKAAADSTKSVLDPLFKVCVSIIESGGCLHAPTGKQTLQSAAAVAGASSAASSAALRSAGTSPGRASVVSGVASSSTPVSVQPAASKRSALAPVSPGEADTACMRLAVACTILRVLRDVPRLDGFVTPGLYRDVCHTVLDPHVSARRAVCHALCRTVTKAGPSLNIRYMAALALVACLPDSDKEVKNEARDALTLAAMACMRNSDAYLKIASGQPDGESAKMKQQAYTRRPELAIFFVLYLLAHDSPRAPSMPQLKEFEKSLKSAGSGVDPASHAKRAFPALREHTAALSMLVDCTLEAARKASAGESAAAATGCLSLLNSLYTRLGGYEDATSAPNGRAGQAFEPLRALLFYTIKAHMNNARAFDKHPAEAYLPVPTLFRAKTASA